MRPLIPTLLISVLSIAAAGEAPYEKALAYFEQKNYDACLTALKPAIKDASEKPDLRILAAHCHTGKKNYADAVAHLKVVAEEFPDRDGVKEDIVSLLFVQGKYREARNAGYRFIESLKDQEKPIPHRLSLALARADLAYGKVSAALSLAREAKQSSDAEVKYLGLITETRALIAQANLNEADIALSYAESMKNSEVHQLLRAEIAEVEWAGQKFPENKRSDLVALYEKMTRSENPEIKNAAQKNLERVREAKVP